MEDIESASQFISRDSKSERLVLWVILKAK